VEYSVRLAKAYEVGKTDIPVKKQNQTKQQQQKNPNQNKKCTPHAN